MNMDDVNRGSSQVRWEKYMAQSDYKNQLEGIAVNLQTQTQTLQMLNTRITEEYTLFRRQTIQIADAQERLNNLSEEAKKKNQVIDYLLKTIDMKEMYQKEIHDLRADNRRKFHKQGEDLEALKDLV